MSSLNESLKSLYYQVIGNWPPEGLNDQDAADHILQYVRDAEQQASEGSEVIDFYLIDLDMPRFGDYAEWDDDTQARYRDDLAHAHHRAVLYGTPHS